MASRSICVQICRAVRRWVKHPLLFYPSWHPSVDNLFIQLGWPRVQNSFHQCSTDIVIIGCRSFSLSCTADTLSCRQGQCNASPNSSWTALPLNNVSYLLFLNHHWRGSKLFSAAGILVNSPSRPQMLSDSAVLQWIGYWTRGSGDPNSMFLFFLFIPFLGAPSCSAYLPPGAFMCSCSVNHHRCFITWSQVETLSSKNVKMSSHVLLCHPCFHCINYGYFFVQQSWSEVLLQESPRWES